MNLVYFTQIQRDVNNVYKNVLYKFLKNGVFYFSNYNDLPQQALHLNKPHNVTLRP